MRQRKGLRDRIAAQAKPISAAIAVFFVVINLLVDLSYSYLDPRIRLN